MTTSDAFGTRINAIPLEPAFVNYIGHPVNNRFKSNTDFVAAVTTWFGKGKSTFAIKCVLAILRAQGKNPTWGEFLDENIIYVPTQANIEDALTNSRLRPLVVDEAGDAMHKQSHAMKSSHEVVETYMAARKNSNASFLCMNKITEFAPFFRNSRINTWFRLYQWDKVKLRGSVMVLQRDESDDLTLDPWGIERVLALRKKKKQVNINEALRNSVSYMGEFDFGALPTPLYDVYRERAIEERKKNVEVKREGKREKAARSKLIRLLFLLNKQDGYTHLRLSKLAGISDTEITRYITEYEELMERARSLPAPVEQSDV